MSRSLSGKLLLGLLTLGLFSLFYWLFSLAIPSAALAFATGTTAIIMAGLLTGRVAAKLWVKAPVFKLNTILALLFAAVLLCLVGIGVFVSEMMEETQFHHFLFTIICLFLASGFAAAIISLVRHSNRSKLQATQAALVQSRAELQLLQSQLSPHFLFNTLNNLYGLSLTNQQKVPALLLRLSDLLRYSVYEAKEVFVPLAEEVNYVRNYIEFEKIRLGERLSLKAEWPDITETSIQIAPMLLIVFVENAFKHAKNTADLKVFIEMTLKVEPDSLLFTVTNSCMEIKPEHTSAGPYSGLGLENVKRRLEMLYPGRYELHFRREKQSFSVALVLKQHENQVFDH